MVFGADQSKQRSKENGLVKLTTEGMWNEIEFPIHHLNKKPTITLGQTIKNHFNLTTEGCELTGLTRFHLTSSIWTGLFDTLHRFRELIYPNME